LNQASRQPRRLEEIALRLALLRGRAPAGRAARDLHLRRRSRRRREGVSAYSADRTAQMGRTSLARRAAGERPGAPAGARVSSRTSGVASPIGRTPISSPVPSVRAREMALGPAMTREVAIQAIEQGARLADEAMERAPI